MNLYEVNYQFVPVYIPQFLFCSMLTHVLQAPLNLDVAVTEVSNYKNKRELYHRVSCFLHFFCPSGSERCFKIERKRVEKNPQSISSKFGSNILLLLLCSRKSTRMLRIGKCLTLDFDLVFFTVIILEYTNIFTVYYYLCSYASKQNEYV
jgi:hypothetical protein